MSPSFWLTHAALTVRQRMDARLRPLGLTYTQFSLLGSVNWLTNTEAPPTQQETSEHSAADRTMASKVLGALAERGLLTRDPDPDNGRKLRLRLTADGKALLTEAVRIVAEVDAEFFGAGPVREELRQHLAAIAAARQNR